MSANLVKNNDVWDDTELVKMYDESCKRISKAIISQAKLEFSVENEDSIDDNVDEECDKEIGEIDHDREDGEMDEEEDEEEGEIREKLTLNSRKRPVLDTVENGTDNSDKNEDGQMTSDEEGEMSTKKFKSNSNSPVAGNNNFDDINLGQQQQQQQPSPMHDQNIIEHPSELSNTLINEHFQSNNTVINKTDMKATINATLGSYWQAGYHIKNLENLLNLEQGSLQIPLPKVIDHNNATQLNSKLNAALISYWQMGYYDASCELLFPHNE